MKTTLRVLIALCALGLTEARADLKLPAVFCDNMVLQCDATVPVWGWSDPGDAVTVSFAGQTKTAKAGADGRWRLDLAPLVVSSEPATLEISCAIGNQKTTIGNVLVGEVWVCSGQSNMAMSVRGAKDAQKDIDAATFPNIRLVTVNRVTANEPQADCGLSPWVACSPETVGGFSAAGFFFGRRLHEDLKIPIGLINTSWGGTCIEAWTPWADQKDDEGVVALKASWDDRDAKYVHEDAMAQFEKDQQAWRDWQKGGRQGKEPRRPRRPVQPRMEQNYPANLYNSMIHPLVPLAIRGAIWYQGEANGGRGRQYRVQLERMIASWRKVWRHDFPFYFVQLPNFREPWTSPVEGGWAEIRESFMNTAKEVPNTGAAITIDIGEAKNIHPKNKQDVGDRLARLALHKTYGKTGFAWCGPIPQSCEFRNGEARIVFDTGGAPLAVKGGVDIVGFALTGVNGVPVRANAKIAGTDTVVVSSPDVPEPFAVHYAWANNPVGVNLANAGGLPASPFRFGEIPKFEVFAKMLPEEAAAYKVVYSFDPTDSRLTAGNTVFVYDEDHSGDIRAPFKKVAYFMALQGGDGKVSYAFVSMDPFTDDVKKIGVPAKATGAGFQTQVTGVTVKSNVAGVTSGAFADGCNIEFWDCNYGGMNASKVPGADDRLHDFGDVPSPEKSPGYGCMQIHNFREKHSVICFNRFGAGKSNDVGIGNWDGKTRDWTFSSSAKNYARGEFKVLVLP